MSNWDYVISSCKIIIITTIIIIIVIIMFIISGVGTAVCPNPKIFEFQLFKSLFIFKKF